MDIIKLIVKKLDSDFLKEEEDRCLRSWIEESYMNESMFFRLEALKNEGSNFSQIIALNPRIAWMKVKQKLN